MLNRCIERSSGLVLIQPQEAWSARDERAEVTGVARVRPPLEVGLLVSSRCPLFVQPDEITARLMSPYGHTKAAVVGSRIHEDYIESIDELGPGFRGNRELHDHALGAAGCRGTSAKEGQDESMAESSEGGIHGESG